MPVSEVSTVSGGNLASDANWPERTIFQKALGIAFGAVLLSGFIYGFSVDPIIDGMPFAAKALLFAWGVLFGALVIICVPSSRPVSSIVKGVITILTGLSFMADGGAAREAYVFAGARGQAVQVLAPIAGSSDCVGRYSRPRLSVTPYPGTSLSIKTTRAICQSFEAQEADGHECVRLEIETGEYGIRRMREPLSIEAC